MKSEIKWYSVSISQRREFINMITRTELDLHDSWMDALALKDHSFSVIDTPNRELLYTDKVAGAFFNAITYEMSLT